MDCREEYLKFPTLDLRHIPPTVRERMAKWACEQESKVALTREGKTVTEAAIQQRCDELRRKTPADKMVFPISLSNHPMPIIAHQQAVRAVREEVDRLLLYDAITGWVESEYDVAGSLLCILISVCIDNEGLIPADLRKKLSEKVPEETLDAIERNYAKISYSNLSAI